jgi:hypothetical protein
VERSKSIDPDLEWRNRQVGPIWEFCLPSDPMTTGIQLLYAILSSPHANEATRVAAVRLWKNDLRRSRRDRA